MSATDELRRMLDERGVEWTVPDESWNQDSITYWKVGSIKWVAFESENDTLWLNCNSVTDLTPAQAIAATLGSCNCSNNCTNSERTGTCLPYFWTHDGVLHIELPKLPDSIKVRLPDQRYREVRSARTWQYTLGEADATRERQGDVETCHDKNGFDFMLGFECTVCGAMTDGYMVTTEDTGHFTQFNFCPNCGAKVVGMEVDE